MATLNFTVAFATTLESLAGQEFNSTVYAEDLGNCGPCVSEKSNCWGCLTTEQQVFNDPSLTSQVADGFYALKYDTDENPAIWHIVGGYPQTEGFFN